MVYNREVTLLKVGAIMENKEHNQEKINIKLERHLWPDELKEKKRKRITTILITLSILVSFGLGILFNHVYLSNRTILVPGGNNQGNVVDATGELKKFQSIYDILSTKWYFSNEMEAPNINLIENAINGMIDLNEDVHTSYLTIDEFEDFQSGLDANFVGIGVQYYNIDGYNIVKRVLPNSPAQRAGVMAGDIFYKVDGDSVIGTDQDTLSDIVRGEEDTNVTIEFKRGESLVNLTITRGPVLSSAYGEMVTDDTGYLEISSFSIQTGTEVAFYLDDMTEKGATKLIIDVRDNGGGYLSTLETIASYFLDKDMIVIQEEFVNGDIEVSYSSGKVYENFEDIVLLVNENSASASEVLTAALKENLDVRVIGVTTFGKGTVQVTQGFDDGSALKYTTAQWLTPKGNYIHGVGIDPTIEMKLHDIFYQEYPDFEELGQNQYRLDSVSEATAYVQVALDFLGYNTTRDDGYYDQATYDALIAYQTSQRMRTDGIVDKELITHLSSAIVREWNLNQDTHDLQYQMALEVIKSN